MLTLIIQIVKERQLCGLSAADKLKRELIYRLVVGDATHSQLVKALPQSISENDQLQNTIDTVAVYSNPSGMNQVCDAYFFSTFRITDKFNITTSISLTNISGKIFAAENILEGTGPLSSSLEFKGSAIS